MHLAVDVFYHGFFAGRFEREVQVSHLEQNDTQAIDIYLAALRPTPHEFWREVGVTLDPFFLRLVHVPFPPERTELDEVVGCEEQVLGVHVLVDVVDVMDLLQCQHNLSQVVKTLVFGEGGFGHATLSDFCAKAVLALDVLGFRDNTVIVFVDLFQANNVGMR